MRRKTKRRLLILALAGILVGALGAGAYALRKLQIAREILKERELGIAAFDRNDLKAAVKHLAKYVRHHPEDADALARYSRALLGLPEHELGYRALLSATSALRRAAQLRPDDISLRRDLTVLFERLGFSTETKESALRLQEMAGEADPDALRALSIAYYRLRQHKEAVDYASRYVEVAPDDFKGVMLLISLREALGESGESSVSLAENWAKDHPGDPSGRLLIVQACLAAGDRNRAEGELLSAVAEAPPDAEFAYLLLEQLGENWMQQEALKYLDGLPPSVFDLRLLRELVRRLWERREFENALARLKAIDVPGEGRDPELVTLRALCLVETGDRDEAAKLAEVLARRKDDPRAEAWSSYLHDVVLNEQSSPKEDVESCLRALINIPGNALLRTALGDAYEKMGEQPLALSTWLEAAAHTQSWALPSIKAARVLLQLGYLDMAKRVAERAARLNPEEPTIRMTLELAELIRLLRLRASTDSDTGNEIEEHLGVLRDLAEKAEDGIVVLASSLTKAGRTGEARSVVSEALSARRDLSSSELLLLASISRRAGLGLADECLRRCEELHGRTAELVYALARRATPEKGREIVRDAVSRAPNPDLRAFRIVEAKYLESVGDEDAARKAWTSIAKDYSKDLDALRAVLASRATWQDRDLIDGAIRSLRSLTGDGAFMWRLYRSRWIVSDTKASTSDLTKVVNLLSSVVEGAPYLPDVQRVLALALDRLGETDAAIKHLSKAAESPRRTVVDEISLARLYLKVSDSESALIHLHRASRMGTATEKEVQIIAGMLADLGETEKAREVLSRYGVSRSGGDLQLLLARIYLTEGKLDRAQRIVTELLLKPNLERVQLAAAVFALGGRAEDARRTLLLLDDLDLQPGEADWVRAEFERRFGNPEASLSHYQRFIEIHPDNRKARVARLRALIALGRSKGVLEALAEDRKAFPSDMRLRTLLGNRDLVAYATVTNELRSLLLALLTGTRDDAAALQAIREHQVASEGRLTRKELARKLADLARRQPGFTELEVLAAQGLAEAGLLREALEISQRTMHTAPSRTEPAQLSAMILSRLGNWTDAAIAAQEWKRRFIGRNLQADLLLADARLRLGEPRSALEVLKPWLAQAQAEPDRYAGVLAFYYYAWVSDGKADAARAGLRDFLPRSPVLRQFWIQRLVNGAPDPRVDVAEWLRISAGFFPDELASDLILAEAWLDLWETGHEEGHRSSARSWLDRAWEHRQDARSFALTKLGLLEETAGRNGRARSAYEQALKTDAGNLVAANNLAIVLVRGAPVSKEQSERALHLAKMVTVPGTRNPEFLDTLAIVHRARKEWAAAATAYHRAWQLDPKNWRWPISLAELWLEAGGKDKAATTIREMDDRTREAPENPEWAKRLADLRAKLE